MYNLLKGSVGLTLVAQATLLLAAPQIVPMAELATAGKSLDASQPGMHQMTPQPLTPAQQRAFMARRDQEIRGNPPTVVAPLAQEKITPRQTGER